MNYAATSNDTSSSRTILRRDDGGLAAASAASQKTVRFSPDPPHGVAAAAATPSSCTSDETERESTTTWYSQSELNAFRDVVRQAGRRAHLDELERLTTTSGGRSPGLGDPSFESDFTSSPSAPPVPRGLDYRSSLERQRNRYVAIRAVLECQRRLAADQLDTRFEPALHLALISAKVTRWARELALDIGRRDFVEAYPDVVSAHHREFGVVAPSPIPPPPSSLSSSPAAPPMGGRNLDSLKPYPNCLKRSLTSSAAGGLVVVGAHRRVVLPNFVIRNVSSLSTASASASSLSLAGEEEDSDDEARRRLRKKRRVDRGHTAGGAVSVR